KAASGTSSPAEIAAAAARRRRCFLLLIRSPLGSCAPLGAVHFVALMPQEQPLAFLAVCTFTRRDPGETDRTAEPRRAGLRRSQAARRPRGFLDLPRESEGPAPSCLNGQRATSLSRCLRLPVRAKVAVKGRRDSGASPAFAHGAPPTSVISSSTKAGPMFDWDTCMRLLANRGVTDTCPA